MLKDNSITMTEPLKYFKVFPLLFDNCSTENVWKQKIMLDRMEYLYFKDFQNPISEIW